MTRKLRIQTEVSAEREVQFKLPVDVPIGPVELEVVVRSGNGATRRTLGDLLHSEFFGIWKDRKDLQDSAEFARTLRERAWKRG